MRQAIRALGWATSIFWIILLFFTVTVVYSAFQLKPEFGSLYTNTSGGTAIVSLPFSFANGGLYDISNLNLTTLVKDSRGNPISDSSTFVQLIPRNGNVSVTHNMLILISQLTTKDLSYLLFKDNDFDVDIALELDYANAVPFKISTNFTVPWGAPLSNLTIGNVSVTHNGVNFVANVPISFENHSFFSLDGTMRLELVDNTNRLLGSETTTISVPPQAGYGFSPQVDVSDPTSIREARLYFDTSVFSYGPVVISFV